MRTSTLPASKFPPFRTILSAGAVILLPLILSGSALQQKACELGPFSEDARYDTVFRKASHNSFEKSRAASLAAVLDKVPTIEIDIWDDENAPKGGEKAGYWYVRHDLRGGNSNNSSSGGGLDACLTDIRYWSDAHPNHEVITIFLDKKQGWGDGGNRRQPADLDSLLTSIIPRDRFFVPVNLQGAHPDLRTAARAGAWPTMRALHGKFVVVLTGGLISLPFGITTPGNKILHQYVAARGSDAIAFVAPETDQAAHIVGTPDHFDATTAKSLVFFNLPHDYTNLGPMVRTNGWMSRTWGIAESNAGFVSTVERCVNFVALDNFAEAGFNGGMMQGVLVSRQRIHHHHKRGSDCEHGKWATDDVEGHHHHKRGNDCEHREWATDDVAGHHHHKRGTDCEHGKWATDDQAF
jgi:hypothetical protein